MKSHISFLVLLLTLPLAASDRQVVEEVIARVNNQIITLSDVEQGRRLLRQELTQQFNGAELEQEFQEREKELLRDLIDQALLVQRGTDAGYSVEADVIKQMDRIRQDMKLATMEELERAIATQGTSVEDFKQQLRDQMMTNLVIQRMVTPDVFVNEEEISEYYQEHKEDLAQPERIGLREILIASEERTEEELEARTREVLEKIRHGEAFEDLAREYSDAPTAEDGGELGYFEPDKLAAQVREAIDGLLDSGVADPLHTSDGYLILQVVEHIPAGIPSLEKIEGRLSQRIFMERMRPKLREFLSQLRREAFVKVKRGYVDSGAVEPPPKPILRGKRRRRIRGEN